MSSATSFVRAHCDAFLGNADDLGYHEWTKVPVLIDWNIGNFSVGMDGEGFKFFSRWDYDWFRIEPRMLDFYFWPDRVILGGGVSKRSAKYWEYLESGADLVKAAYLNTSGIIGAAYAAGLAAHEEDAAKAAVEAAAKAARKPATRRRSTRGTATKKRG